MAFKELITEDWGLVWVDMSAIQMVIPNTKGCQVRFATGEFRQVLEPYNVVLERIEASHEEAKWRYTQEQEV